MLSRLNDIIHDLDSEYKMHAFKTRIGRFYHFRFIKGDMHLGDNLNPKFEPFWAKCHMSLFVITWNIYKIPSSLTKLASKQEAPKVPNLLITYIVCEPLNLLWSNFLIGHPLDTYLWIINDKAQKGHQKHIFLDEMGCMFNNIDTNLSSIANWNGRTYVFTSRERESLLASESSPTPKLDKTIYIIRNCWLNENLIPGPI